MNLNGMNDAVAPKLVLADAVSAWLAAAVPAWLDAPDPSGAMHPRGLRTREWMSAANLWLVVNVAKKFVSSVERVRLGLGYLLQIGAVGLVRGGELFDPIKGYKLSTDAYW